MLRFSRRPEQSGNQCLVNPAYGHSPRIRLQGRLEGIPLPGPIVSSPQERHPCTWSFTRFWGMTKMTSHEMQPSSSRPESQAKENPATKADIDFVESAGAGGAATYEESVAARLPKGHRDYLLERHGTLELDPIPGMSPADPYNWPEWKVSTEPRPRDGPKTSYSSGVPVADAEDECRNWPISFWWHSMPVWGRSPRPPSFPRIPSSPRN